MMASKLNDEKRRRNLRREEPQGPATTTAESSLQNQKRQKRHANLYDAVAGRVTTTEPLTALRSSASRVMSNRDGFYTLQDSALAPEEVLFRRHGAPQRYSERDIYFSQDQEPPAGQLPDSDLLKAVHCYTSQFYESLGSGGRGDADVAGVSWRGSRRAAPNQPKQRQQCFIGSRHVDERSMDETALLAFGILLEEAGREALGRRGDMVFTQGIAQLEVEAAATLGREVDVDSDVYSRASGDGGGRSHREISVGPIDGESSWRRDYPKRRKTQDGSQIFVG